MATLTVTGITSVSTKLMNISKNVPERAARALNVIAEETMTDAKRRTPVDTGTLRRSGNVHQHATSRRLSAEMSFGTEYGVYVHERMDVHHPVGEAKFLERAIQSTSNWFEARLANEIKFDDVGGTGAGSSGGVGNL